jgi:hypothetical protein
MKKTTKRVQVTPQGLKTHQAQGICKFFFFSFIFYNTNYLILVHYAKMTRKRTNNLKGRLWFWARRRVAPQGLKTRHASSPTICMFLFLLYIYIYITLLISIYKVNYETTKAENKQTKKVDNNDESRRWMIMRMDTTRARHVSSL